MLESNTIKYIKSLHQKKFRELEQEFIVEGVKMVNELLLSNFETTHIFTTDPNCIESGFSEVTQISEKELGRISCLKSANKVLATVKIPTSTIALESVKTGLNLILEDIQDPGNMGTIIRLASWYGIKNIFCSPNTVDCFNPKVVQATMGAIFKVPIYYTDIYALVDESRSWTDFNTYVTHLHGSSVYDTPLTPNGFIVMGNESQGVSEKMSAMPVKKLKLPSYPPELQTMESLNVAVATALTVAEFRRRQML